MHGETVKLEIHFEGYRKLSEIKNNSLSKLEHYCSRPF